MARELNIGIGTTGLTVTATPYLAGVAQATIAMTELGATGVYQGNMTGAAGVYEIVFISAGATKGAGTILWDGTRETNLLIVSKILRNKMVTDPTTGIMTLYDDDNVTPYLTAQLYKDAAGTITYNGTGAERRQRLV